MIELSECQFVNTFKPSGKRNDTLIIDNGVYELRAGYKGCMSISVKNMIYKNKDRVSFDSFPLASAKSMFDGDVVINFDVLEHTVDMILEHIKPDELENLIITSTPHSPTETDLVEFLFSVYKFKKIQVGTDFIYTYHRYFKGEECLIIALKYSSIIVSYVNNGSIEEIYKIGFGGKDLLDYINFVMADRYREHRRDFRGLAKYMRVSSNYNEESVQIYKEMCAGNYNRNIFISDVVEAAPEQAAKKSKKVSQHNTSLAIPSVDYILMDTDDSLLDSAQQKEKRKHRMLYNSALYRLKAKIDRALQSIDESIEGLEDAIERKSNESLYITKKKARFEELKRNLELRERLRNEAKNRKTREFQIKNKEGPLTPEEQKIRDALVSAEDEEVDLAILAQLDSLSAEILELDPDFIPYYANTAEILRGDNIGRQCVNVELIKWPEIFFYPSMIGSEEMGLAEILEYLSVRRNIHNVLICGGFSFMKDVGLRIESYLNSLSTTGNVNVVISGNSEAEAFDGACFSSFYPIYTREEFERNQDELLNQ